MTRIAGSPSDNEAAWEALPGEMEDLNRGLAQGLGSALISTLTVQGERMPVLAVRSGRRSDHGVDDRCVVALVLLRAAKGAATKATCVSGRALRWLVADPDDRRVVVQPSVENLLLGEALQVTARVRDAGFVPVALASRVGWKPRWRTIAHRRHHRRAGFRVCLGCSRAGRRASGADQGGRRHRGRVQRDVEDPELAEIVPDEAFLNALADAYGDRESTWVRFGSTPLRDEAPPAR